MGWVSWFLQWTLGPSIDKLVGMEKKQWFYFERGKLLVTCTLFKILCLSKVSC